MFKPKGDECVTSIITLKIMLVTHIMYKKSFD